VGTPGAEHQGCVGTPGPQLSPTQAIHHGSVVPGEMPRLSRGSLPLKVALSQHRYGDPASSHKATGAASVPGARLMLEVGVLLSTPWLSPTPHLLQTKARTRAGSIRDCPSSVLGSCTPCARP